MFIESYWDDHYLSENTPWDMRRVSPPLKSYIDQLESKNLDILIPGAGNAYEAEYLWQNGFTKVDVLDISRFPLQNFAQRFPTFPQKNLIHENFFNVTKKYDLILEQTFFCALHPSQRQSYSEKAHSLLKDDGTLAGLLFTFPLDIYSETPPFGGSLEEYRGYFSDLFSIKIMETAYNSHPARQNREVFILLKKQV